MNTNPTGKPEPNIERALALSQQFCEDMNTRDSPAQTPGSGKTGMRYANKRLAFRGAHGQFRQATAADFGLGVCSICRTVTIRVYTGDPSDRPANPQKFRQRCFHCEPETQQERNAREERMAESKEDVAT